MEKKIISTKSRKTVNSGIIYTATCYPEWQCKTIDILKELYEQNNSIDQKVALGKLKSNSAIKRYMKLAVPLVKELSVKVSEIGAAALELKMPFNEKEFLEENKDYLQSTLNLPLKIVDEDGSQKISAVPLSPTLYFE